MSYTTQSLIDRAELVVRLRILANGTVRVEQKDGGIFLELVGPNERSERYLPSEAVDFDIVRPDQDPHKTFIVLDE